MTAIWPGRSRKKIGAIILLALTALVGMVAYLHHCDTRQNSDRESAAGSHEVMDVSDKRDESFSSDLQRSIAEFKAKPGFREAAARKLIPHLAVGMTVAQVTNLLGQPSRKDEGGLLWRYGVFYSQMIEIYFNREGKVETIVPVGVEVGP